ncbi:MAG: hypothetical protein KJ025_11205 [Burkholderiales bacterium]|nr:hypothetical protein [Burkholderiales bacterium]
MSAIVALVRLVPLLALLAAPPARAALVDVYFFWGIGCPHCERAVPFLQELAAERSDLRVHYLEVTRQTANRTLFLEVASRMTPDDQRFGVPYTVVGERVFVGYDDAASLGARIRAAIDECRLAGCVDRVRPLFGPGVRPEPPRFAPAPPAAAPAGAIPAVAGSVRLPLLGEVGLRELSLPALTVVLAAADGFNPCAMWVLVFLIGLVAGMRDRRRMWLLGGVFLLASAAVYYLFMAAWLNVLLLVGMIVWIRIGIGLLALAGGGYYLREFFVNPEGVCKVTAGEGRRRTLDRLRELARMDALWIALGGIVVLALAVNLVELFCSAGIPAVYTQVLALSPLATWQYHAYLALYVVVFMLDDLVVFFVALKTLEVTGLTARYSRWSHLVGGVVLVGIGAALIARPEWLMWG